MNRIALCLLLMTAGACGKRSAAGTIVGGGAGVAIGLSMDKEGNNATLVAAGIGAVLGLVVGGILDLNSRDAWACPDSDPKCYD